MPETNYLLTQSDIEAINRLLKNAHRMGPEFITVINMNVLETGKLVDFEIGVSDKDFQAVMPISLATNNKTIFASVRECLAGVK